LIPSYIRNSNISVVVYDITNRESFDNVRNWVDEVRAERSEEVSMILVGNKADLADKRMVSLEEGETRAKELGIPHVETSAKTGFNVRNLFIKVTSEIYLKATGQHASQGVMTANVDITKSDSQGQQASRRGCC
jgi:small GTP-binding protein